MAQRLLPHDLSAEIAVVGSVMRNPEVAALVFAMLTPEDFHDPRCRKVFAVERDLDQGLDYITIHAELEARGWLKQVSPAFLTRTVSETPFGPHGIHYARVVRRLSQQRQLIHLAERLARQAFGPGEDTSIEDIISAFGHELLALATAGPGTSIPAPEAVETKWDEVTTWAENPIGPAAVRGLSTGLGPVDSVLNGMQAGNLIMLAARPSMGKSALGFDIARRVASQRPQVLIFSLEMGHKQVVGRWASALSGVPSSRLERGLCPPEYAGTAMETRYLSRPELESYYRALDEIRTLSNLTINDQASLRAEQIRAQALSQAAKVGGLDLVVVDHTGLIDAGAAGRNELSAKREGAKSRAMKALAKELGAPLILLQQLNRALEARRDKRPSLADLRDSGEHEENADVVICLFSEQYYKLGQGNEPDKLELLCLKHRHGQRQRRALLCYERTLSRFSEFAPGPAPG